MASKKPALTTLHLVALDHFEHETGPGSEKSKATLTAIDTAVGELVATARAAQPDLVVAIVSDHGFAEIRDAVNLFIPFIEAGLITYDAEKKAVTGWDAMPWGAGGSAAVVLSRPDDKALQKKVGDLLGRLARDPNMKIARVADAKEIARMGGGTEPSFWVDFTPGVSTMGYNYAGPVITPTESKGTHGFFPDHKEMRASFFIDGAPGLKGSLGEVDMRDIAPTLASILGVDLDGATGKPLKPGKRAGKR
jgi:predicted AlkP superfamily pyrophosphatase or phosphodiesterase